MHKIILLISLFILQNLFGQDDFEKIKLHLQSFDYVQELKSLRGKKFGSFETLVITDLLKRKLDFGYEHHRYILLPVSGNELRLNILVKNDSIIHGWLSYFNSVKKRHSHISEFKSDPIVVEDYVHRHNKFYKSKLGVIDFQEQLIEEYLVGFGCGYTGRDTSPKTKESMGWVKQRKKHKLNGNLISFSPELQTLGAMGLMSLNKLNDEQNRIIQHLLQRNSVINSCLADIYGMGETFSERINRNNNKTLKTLFNIK
ncbi:MULTISPECIES: hypothetical protein [Flavobacteriaceae]|uniref:Uncharacterized protein n=1 Tax=Flagellimonas alvinocaridis TaxID=2530200 RepID=A0A4S8RRA8_9FLAO|nr:MULTISPECIES: hypothetical protein [Allomuricauda]MDC6363490.1 hypothetical protein [Muricauda sp. SP22]THV57629.1 hypothetical protein EZV76_14815 [Allomuricauda alvinocaridis]